MSSNTWEGIRAMQPDSTYMTDAVAAELPAIADRIDQYVKVMATKNGKEFYQQKVLQYANIGHGLHWTKLTVATTHFPAEGTA